MIYRSDAGCWNAKNKVTQNIVSYFTEEFNPGFAKPPLNFTGSLAKPGLNSLVE